MNMLSRSLSLATVLSTVVVTGVYAQSNDGSSAARVDTIAVPEYPAGYSNPALLPGGLPPGATNIPVDENPNVAGATGFTIVRGDRSTISGDRAGTIEQRTGSVTASDAPG
jgi:hypothetical protein